MSTDFITKEVQKIVKEQKLEYPLNIAMATAWILGNFKGINLKILDVAKSSSLTDFFVLGSATNPTMAQSMADEITRQLKGHGYEVISREGSKKGDDWILLDFGDIIVHVFLDVSRSVYDLDNLWENATEVEIPNSYYFSSDDEEKSEDATGKSYF
ncbi:ribosome silencing factor [Halobacteriovorax sp. JY17]|uniref:ribosome silencing factor n=1 Tax=Halobacteriovorax sp. JY17 TaxID=2014617 RepID=UPI000C46DF2B|nr:ribosome silencing factor [Halobacteriovorax sp. JY17]PIK13901.1 MAG: ribosome silencing factor [Halobacteriovorax sp. JY17]